MPCPARLQPPGAFPGNHIRESPHYSRIPGIILRGHRSAHAHPQPNVSELCSQATPPPHKPRSSSLAPGPTPLTEPRPPVQAPPRILPPAPPLPGKRRGLCSGSRGSDVTPRAGEAVVPARRSRVPVRGRPGGHREGGKGARGLQRGGARGMDPRGRVAAGGAAPTRWLRLPLRRPCPRWRCPSQRGVPATGDRPRGTAPGLRQPGLPYLLYWRLQRARSELEGNNWSPDAREQFPAFSWNQCPVRIGLMGRRGRKMRR